MTREQSRSLLGEQLAGLVDGGVGHLGEVDLAQAAVRIDRKQGRGVIDLAVLDLGLDAVRLPHPPQLRRRRGEEMPLGHHPVRLRVSAHFADAGGRRISVDPEQLDV